MKLRALHDGVIVRRLPRESMTVGGLHIPQTALDRAPSISGDVPINGIVVAVGPEATNRCVVGDEVMFEKHGGKEEEIDGQFFGFFKADEIIAIVER